MYDSSAIPSYFSDSEHYSSALNLPISQGYPSTSQPTYPVRFSTLPEPAVVQSLVDTYFRYCHCQPYCYFHVANFRHRLSKNALPHWLLLAVIATAAGFSDDEIFQGRQTEASDCFASLAWKEINDRMFQEEDFMTIHTVQAVNMLAVIDFSGKALMISKTP